MLNELRYVRPMELLQGMKESGLFSGQETERYRKSYSRYYDMRPDMLQPVGYPWYDIEVCDAFGDIAKDIITSERFLWDITLWVHAPTAAVMLSRESRCGGSSRTGPSRRL